MTTIKDQMTHPLNQFFPANILDAIGKGVLTLYFAIAAYVLDITLEHKYVIGSIIVVIVVDWFFGTWLAIKTPGKKFSMSKFIRKPLHMVGYYVIFLALASMESAFKMAGWVVEGFMFPILIFQLWGAIQNAHKVGVIKGKALHFLSAKYDNLLESSKPIQNEQAPTDSPE